MPRKPSKPRPRATTEKGMNKAQFEKEILRKKIKEEADKFAAEQVALAVSDEDFDYESYRNDQNEATAKQEILWEPQSQVHIDFLSSNEDEVLFSGGRGSGKSACLIVDPLRWVTNSNFRGLIMRRTMPELRDLIKRAKALYPKFAPGTKWREQEKMFLFPSGAAIEFGYCDSDEDLERYRGQEYTWIGIDELTQFENPDIIDILKASLRTTDKSLKTYIRATTNPSGRGTSWVKRRWVDLGVSGERTTQEYTFGGKTYVITRKWFNSTIFDNPALLNGDPNYVGSLLAIDNDIKRQQWFEGKWIAEGLAFDEFSTKVHVIDPFPIPSGWYKFRACDWGYSSMAVCVWIAIDYDNNMYVYREYATKKENADIFAGNVLQREQLENIKFGVLDSSVWAKRGEVGENAAETMLRLGCTWTPADGSDGSRKAGKLLLHRWLALNEDTGEPRLKIFSTCKELIKELSSLPLDKNDLEDVDTKACDHAYDALRYGLLSRPDLMADNYIQSMNSTPVRRPDQSFTVDNFFGY